MKLDALVIGSGQAGNPLARSLAGAGQKVALAEAADIGGSCVNFGCSPSKTIIASARVAHMTRRAADYGVITGEVTVDFGKVMARQQKVVHDFRHGDTVKLHHAGVTILHGWASFEDEHHVRVGDERVEADRIYLNTGSRARIPSVPGLERPGFIDDKEVLDLKTLPEHLIVLGGGYIGAEYAQAFRRFGSEVTILEEGERILSHEDKDIADVVSGAFESEGIRILTKTKLTQAAHANGRVQLTVTCNGATETIEGSTLLVATGHVPNSDGMGLEKAGVKTGPRGYIETDDHLQTSVPHIWALGDVNGKGAFTHTSYNDYEVVWDNFNGGQRRASDRLNIYGVFVDPPLGRVGMDEEEARKSGHKVLISTMKMSAINRAIERDETRGMMKVLVDAETNLFLGATIVGIEGDEVVHIIADLMYAEAPYTVMMNAVHSHPTISELLPTMLHSLKPLE